MRTLPLLLSASPAAAHPGHIADLSGHDPWVLSAGLGAIAGAAILGWLTGGKRAEEEPTEDTAPEDPAGQPT
ncbi:MAG: DUF6732 family protein [Pseudomonadota bacterium]